MNRLFVALCVAIPAVSLGGCAGGYYGGDLSVGSPYAYNGFYDDYYGPIYDGYWGTDGGFYYRRAASDRSYRRGDARHFHRDRAPSEKFHAIQGSVTPGRGMHMPRFPGQGQQGGRRGRH